MGKQRIGRKRRRRFHKKDAPVVTLASLTIILIFVWGGLYWNESSEKALSANANVTEKEQQALQGNDVLSSADSTDSAGLTGLNTEANDQPSAKDESETMDSTVTSSGERGGNSDTSSFTDASNATESTVTKSGGVQNPAKSDVQNSAKAGRYSPPKFDAHSPTKSDVENPSKSDGQYPAKSDEPSPTTSTNQAEPAVNQAEKYEQHILEAHAKCTKDMNGVSHEAEKSFQQIDMRNPISIQAWREKVTKEIVTAESTCDAAFQEQIQGAEKASVSGKVIEEWTSTYTTLKVGLKKESEAKLQQLMGG